MPAEDSAQSSRVSVTMSRMVRMPWPSSPSRKPNVSENSTSLEAFERLPSLSFKRWKRSPLSVPSSRMRGTRKQLSASPVLASMMKASDIGAERNHLWPTSRYIPSPTFSAVERLARTSVPPCFSVIPMPSVMPVFCIAAFWLESYLRATILGSQLRSMRGEAMIGATEALVMVIGHRCPLSSPAVR